MTRQRWCRHLLLGRFCSARALPTCRSPHCPPQYYKHLRALSHVNRYSAQFEVTPGTRLWPKLAWEVTSRGCKREQRRHREQIDALAVRDGRPGFSGQRDQRSGVLATLIVGFQWTQV
ncbi:hypothetical protein M407DRAFT_242153 [Tulasnella calospora MUT 4182]|uniref:Secreted protein n=1 Tax=Tulasnella calospora MUT 4182 TaxID=1051891 RepID=A0A0C3M9W5_9AGAM|nr:hypothetical protein M407DRAFT_242153 [Tulasnella calospora MUT 4182]